MSYGFTVTGATKTEVVEKIAAEFEKVVELQPIHARDRASAIAAAYAFMDLLTPDPEKDISCSVHGSLSWVGTGDSPVISHAGLHIGAGHAARRAPEAA